MSENEHSKRLPSEAFSLVNESCDTMLYVGLLSFDRKRLLSPNPLRPALFKTELDPTLVQSSERRAITALSHEIGTTALSAVSQLWLGEGYKPKGYLLSASTRTVSSESFEIFDEYTKSDIEETLEMAAEEQRPRSIEERFLELIVKRIS